MSFQQSGPDNPYGAPHAYNQPGSGPPRPGHCPNCGSRNFKTPGFTWWGGAVGQKIISHVVCQNCNTGFNKKTGASNTANIILYQVVAAAIVFPLVLLLLFLLYQLG